MRRSGLPSSSGRFVVVYWIGKLPVIRIGGVSTSGVYLDIYRGRLHVILTVDLRSMWRLIFGIPSQHIVCLGCERVNSGATDRMRYTRHRVRSRMN